MVRVGKVVCYVSKTIVILIITALTSVKALGVIGYNQTGAKSRGLHMHSTLVVTTEGLPLGVLQSEVTTPKPKSKDDNRPAFAIPIEEKKTFSWIEGVRDCQKLKSQSKVPEVKRVNKKHWPKDPPALRRFQFALHK
jgi:hypothetical protein